MLQELIDELNALRDAHGGGIMVHTYHPWIQEYEELDYVEYHPGTTYSEEHITIH